MAATTRLPMCVPGVKTKPDAAPSTTRRDRHGEAVHSSRVQRARRLLEAGFYDQPEVLAATVNRVYSALRRVR